MWEEPVYSPPVGIGYTIHHKFRGIQFDFLDFGILIIENGKEPVFQILLSQQENDNPGRFIKGIVHIDVGFAPSIVISTCIYRNIAVFIGSCRNARNGE